MPPQHAIDPKQVLHELEAHNDFFDELVDMIPAKVYVSDKGKEDTFNPKYHKAQSKESKEARRAKNKIDAKKKFDPEQRESTRQQKRRLEQEKDDDDDDDDMNDVHFGDLHEEEDAEEGPPSSAETRRNTNDNPNKAPDSKATSDKDRQKKANQSRIEELRSKLRKKLEERQTHQAINNTTNDTVISKRAARRAQKKQRIEEAKKRSEMMKSSIAATSQAAKSGIGATKIKIVDRDLGGSKINADTGSAPKNAMDDLSGIDFGGIAGLKDDVLKGNYSSFNKSLNNMGKKKSLERLLAEAEAKKERLRQLKASNEEEDKEKAKKMEWGDTLKAASGGNTRKTDPALLKKALKRKTKKKSKSQEAWKSRMEQTKDKVDQRQSIRNHNVKQRALGGEAGANLSSKRIKDNDGEEGAADSASGDKKKRPRLGPHAGKGRAGFEGKKQDFINKGNKSRRSQ